MGAIPPAHTFTLVHPHLHLRLHAKPRAACMHALLRVLRACAGYGYLIVATSTQCHVYACSNLNTPHIFDLKDTVTLLLQVRRLGGGGRIGSSTAVQTGTPPALCELSMASLVRAP